MTKLIFDLEPMPQSRPRFTKRGHAYELPKTKEYKYLVEALLRRQWGPTPQLQGPLRVSFRFVFVKPKSARRTDHTVKPDIDNLIKLVFDVFNGVVWVDDAQITQVYASKEYGAIPRTEVMVYNL